MNLRGFDSYPITLGDEMRGERASLGRTVEDVERDLRIRKRVIVAIENCDLEGFPNRSVVAGYVRSYARYLGMDPEDAYQRFCRESGYQSPAAMMAQEDAARRRAPLPLLPAAAVGAEIANSRFAAPPVRSRFMAPVSLGAITSTAALLGLMAGLTYGGWALLQDIQRVGFAPIPQAPAIVAQAPLIAAPAVEPGASSLADAGDYQDGGIFAAVVAPEPLEPIEALRRDGPISAIDPRTAGVFAPGPVGEEPAVVPVDSADDAIRHAELAASSAFVGTAAAAAAAIATAGASSEDAEAHDITLAALAGGDAAGAEPAAGSQGIALHAAEDAWVRVRERDNVIFEGILTAGQKYELPPRVDGPVLKSGNAGGIFVLVDGVAYGPLGPRGQIARDVSLTPEDIRGSMPQATSFSLVSAGQVEVQQRAEVAVARQ